MLLLAVAPAFLYIDHWGDFESYAAAGPHALGTTSGIPHHSDHAAHQTHCHFGSASCADQVVPVNSQVLPRVVEMPSPTLATAFALHERTPSLEGVTFAPPTEPPQL